VVQAAPSQSRRRMLTLAGSTASLLVAPHAVAQAQQSAPIVLRGITPMDC